jgi:hypothetical protein
MFKSVAVAAKWNALLDLCFYCVLKIEALGIEPRLPVPKTGVLPLYYASF